MSVYYSHREQDYHSLRSVSEVRFFHRAYTPAHADRKNQGAPRADELHRNDLAHRRILFKALSRQRTEARKKAQKEDLIYIRATDIISSFQGG